MRSWRSLAVVSLAACVAVLTIVHVCGTSTPETRPVERFAVPSQASVGPSQDTQPATNPPATGPAEMTPERPPRMETDASILIAGSDLYEAALFLAHVYGVNVLVLEGSNEPVRLALSDDDADRAFERLARVGNMAMAKQFGMIIIGPEENLARLTDERTLKGPLFRPAGSTRVDLKLYRIKWDALLGITPDSTVMGGRLLGAFTVYARNTRLIDIMEVLFQMAGSKPVRNVRGVTLEEDAVLPDTGPPVSEAIQACEAKPKLWDVKLPGVPLAAMKLTGISRRPDSPRMALITHTSIDPCATRFEVLRVSDFLGKAPSERCGSAENEKDFAESDDVCAYRLSAIHNAAVELELVRDGQGSRPYSLELDTGTVHQADEPK